MAGTSYAGHGAENCSLRVGNIGFRNCFYLVSAFILVCAFIGLANANRPMGLLRARVIMALYVVTVMAEEKLPLK